MTRRPESIFDLFDQVIRPMNILNDVPAHVGLLPRLMSNRTLEDGTKVLELNLAGFKDEEINLQVDEAKHELHVKAERTAEDDARTFSCTVPLNQYNTAEDVKVKYEYGVLTVTISSGADRKQASLVQIELGK